MEIWINEKEIYAYFEFVHVCYLQLQVVLHRIMKKHLKLIKIIGTIH